MNAAPKNEGWNLPLALGVMGVLGLVAVLMVVVAMRIFDTFDPLTEALIGAIFVIGFLGANGAVIFYLHSMNAPPPEAGDQEDNADG